MCLSFLQDAGNNTTDRNRELYDNRHGGASSAANNSTTYDSRLPADYYSTRDYNRRSDDERGNGTDYRMNGYDEHTPSLQEASTHRASYHNERDHHADVNERRKNSRSPQRSYRSRSPHRSSSSHHSSRQTRSRSRGRDHERQHQRYDTEERYSERRMYGQTETSATHEEQVGVAVVVHEQATIAPEEQQPIQLSENIPDGAAKNAIRIFNLPPTINNEAQIHELCSNYGKIVRVRMIKATAVIPEHAVVAYSELKPAENARTLLDGWKLHEHILQVRYNTITESATRDVRLRDGTVVPPAAASRPFTRGPQGKRHDDA